MRLMVVASTPTTDGLKLRPRSFPYEKCVK